MLETEVVMSYEITKDATLVLIYENIFHNNIEAEICKKIKNILRINPRLRF